jgi:hypothetical protein
MLLSLSDLLLASTLFVNAGAVLNFKLPSPGVESEDGLRGRLITVTSSLRVFRIPLALWNLLMLMLMLIWFN